MRRTLLAIAACMAAATMSPAQVGAQTPQQRTWCYDDKATDPQTIDGCTALILSGGLAGRDLAIVYYNRGIGYEGTNQLALALSDYNSAIRLDPNYADAFDNRGNTYFKTGDNQRAIADFDRAIEIKPDFALAFSNRGYVYYSTGQYDQAIQDLDRSITLDASRGRSFVNRALVRIAKHDCAGAAEDYVKARQLNWEFTISDESRAACGAALTAAGL